mgnify:CR=1 FL=1
MSYPGVDPSDTIVTEPVGAQAVSEGVPNPLLAGVDARQVEEAVRQEISNAFAVSDAWKSKQTVKFVIDCPSGQKALVKHLDTMDLVNADLIEELDFFTKKLFATQVESDNEQSEETGLFATLRDVNKRCRFLDMTGRLMAAASVKPKIIHDGVAVVENSETGEKEIVFGNQVAGMARQIELFGKHVPSLKDGQCYSGPIDFADRMMFFSELNKPLELIEQFRDEPNAVLGSVQPVQELELPPI